MQSKAIIILGHSHVGAIHEALSDIGAYDPKIVGAHFFVHDVWPKRTDYAGPDGKGGLEFNKDVLAAIERVVPQGMPREFICLMGGNGHIVLSLAKHERPFDFILKENPGLALDPEAEILPMAYIKKILTPFIMPYAWQMISLRTTLGVRISQLETCPPYADDEYVRDHLGSYISDPSNIVTSALRMKMWRLHSSIISEIASASDINFLGVPKEALDENGFMQRNGYGPDATHANKWYGQLVVKQMVHSLPIASYTRFTE